MKEVKRVGHLCNKLFEFSDRLVQVRSNTDWRGDGLALQIHNMNLHHHLCRKSETHPDRHRTVILLGIVTIYASVSNTGVQSVCS